MCLLTHNLKLNITLSTTTANDPNPQLPQMILSRLNAITLGSEAGAIIAPDSDTFGHRSCHSLRTRFLPFVCHQHTTAPKAAFPNGRFLTKRAVYESRIPQTACHSELICNAFCLLKTFGTSHVWVMFGSSKHKKH